MTGVPTLNLKDPDVYRLARELADRRGMSMTAAVRAALSEAIQATDHDRDVRRAHIDEIARRSAARPEPFTSDDDLYDELGLPR